MNREARSRIRFSKSTIIIFALSTLLLISLIVLFVLFFRLKQNPGLTDVDIDSAGNVDEKLYATDIKEAIKDLDVKISSSTENQEKANLLLDKVRQLYNAQSFLGEDHRDDIKDCLYQAESTYPTHLTAYSIYRYESSYGDKSIADQYYLLYEDRMKNLDPIPEEQKGEN